MVRTEVFQLATSLIAGAIIGSVLTQFKVQHYQDQAIAALDEAKQAQENALALVRQVQDQAAVSRTVYALDSEIDAEAECPGSFTAGAANDVAITTIGAAELAVPDAAKGINGPGVVTDVIYPPAPGGNLNGR